MELTVVMANYLRPRNVAIILESLAAQTVSHRLFVWDNSPDQSFTGQADWVIRSSTNAKCAARWWLAARADTPWVLVIDDDVVPSDCRVLQETVESLVECDPVAVGAAGVRLDPAKSYSKCQHVGYKSSKINGDMRVDVLKGRYFAVSTHQLQSVGFLAMDAEDDISVSAAIGGGLVLAWLQDRLRDLPTGSEAWCRRPGHYKSREVARRKLFGR